MNKEQLSPLEALDELRYRITNFNGKFHNYKELMETIETALKRKEELEIENSKQFKEKLVQDNLAMTFELNVAKTQLKALEIIREKGLSLLHKSLIISSKNYKEYRQEFQLVRSREFKNEYFYSQEEYGLLKEVML